MCSLRETGFNDSKKVSEETHFGRVRSRMQSIGNRNAFDLALLPMPDYVFQPNSRQSELSRGLFDSTKEGKMKL